MTLRTYTLATLECSPPCTAEIEAESEDAALDADFDELEWTDDLGRPVEFCELDSPIVVIAED